MNGTRRITLVGIQQLSRVALYIAISSIILQACQSRNMPKFDAQESTGASTLRMIIKATVSECEIRSGEYVQPASIVPNDIVDCLLSGQLRRLFKATVSECEIRGGEYVRPASIAPNDTVDCLLSDQLRRHRLGDGRQIDSRIVGNVYDYLIEPGTEKPGCGLYSYVLFPVDTSRSESLLDVVFTTMSYVERSGLACDNLNVLYLPTKAESLDNLLQIMLYPKKRAAVFADEFYDYALARQLLGQVCLKPPNALREVCATDLSRGPYLFTYSTPVSAISLEPPLFLLVDLSNVHERAFKEFVAAYKEQVKRANFNDRERIDTFRLGMLSIVLTAADWVGPIRGAVADTLHLTLGGDQD